MWEVARRFIAVSPLLMPSFMAVVRRLVVDLANGTLLRQLGTSLAIIAAGSAMATICALAAVILSGASRWVNEALDAAGALFHPLPGIALLPVIILWFGVGTTAVTVVIVHSVFWPLLTNLQAGRRAMPAVWRMVAATFGMSRIATAIWIGVPGTVPYGIAGLRIAWARSWRALISAEMVFGAVSGGGGIGWYLFSRRVFMDAEGLFAGILLVMIVGIMVEYLLFATLERATHRRWGTTP